MRNSDCGVRNKFTVAEILILRKESEAERARLKAADLHPPFVLSEAMLKFAQDYNEGNTWNTENARKFAAKIKKHLQKDAAPAGIITSHGACSRNNSRARD